MGPWQSFASYWKNYFNFKGRSSRSAYWWVQLWLLPSSIITILPQIFKIPSEATLKAEDASQNFLIFLIAVYIVLLINVAFTYVISIASMSLTSRRLHDIGVSAWWYVLITVTLTLLSFVIHPLRQVVPFWAFIFILVSLIPSSGPNKYGEAADV